MRSRLFPSLLQTKKLFYEYSKHCRNNVVTYSQLRQVNKFSTSSQKCSNDDKPAKSRSDNLLGSIGSTHKIFEDKDAEIILDISEKKETINLDDLRIEKGVPDPYEGINLKRGVNGVFEIEELVQILQRDNAKNIFVAIVPPELSYIDYMVVVSGRSTKHMKALATFIRKVYKLKRHSTDLLPKIEGPESKNWIALDLGNIVLHIFSHNTRLVYDLETLWSVGCDYDEKSKITTEDIMEQYNAFLSDLEPMENDPENSQLSEN